MFETLQRDLLDAIQRLGLRAGDALPSEGDLAQTLGVSRSSLREATRALQSQGILEARPGTGLFLREFSLDPVISLLPYQLVESGADLDELLVARAALERGLIRQVADRIGDERLRRLDDLVGRMHELEQAGRVFPAEDREFHRLLYLDLHNRVVDTTLDAFWKLMDRLRTELPPLRYDDLAARHGAIVAALRDPGSQDPVRAMDAHFVDIQIRTYELRRADAPRGEDERS